MATGYVYLHPNAGIAPSDNPALWARADIGNYDWGVIQYTDNATDENYDWSLAVPGDWASGGTLTLYWRVNSATTNACRWSVQCISLGDTEASNAAFNTEDVANYANGAATANIVNIDTLTLTNGITGWAASEMLEIRIRRDSANAGDTLTAVTVELLLAVLSYTTT